MKQQEEETSSIWDMWKLTLKFLKFKAFNEDLLMLVIEDSTYAQWVPIQLGTLHIDRALDLISEKNSSTKHKMGTK